MRLRAVQNTFLSRLPRLPRHPNHHGREKEKTHLTGLIVVPSKGPAVPARLMAGCRDCPLPK